MNACGTIRPVLDDILPLTLQTQAELAGDPVLVCRQNRSLGMSGDTQLCSPVCRS